MQCSSLENLAEHKTIKCITELPLMYEACTVDDLHEVYDCLGLGEGEIFTAITVAVKSESVAEREKKSKKTTLRPRPRTAASKASAKTSWLRLRPNLGSLLAVA